jgi:hypothetical protein
MAPNLSELGESIRRELVLLRDLSADLIASRKAFVGSDLERIYEHISRQAALSEKLTAAQQNRLKAFHALSADSPDSLAAPNSTLRSAMDALDAPTAAYLRGLLTELALAEGEVRNLNRVHSLLLDGSRRTLNILSNALAAFAPTYSQPAMRSAAPETAPAAPPALETSRP